MLQRFSRSSLTILVLVSAVNVLSYAQSLSPLTRHVREATLNGQAPVVGHLAANHVMHLVLVLPLRNQDELETLLHDLYDPSSSSYRHFLTVEEFTAKFGPTEEDYDAVIRFARENGFTIVSTSRNRVNL